MPARVDISSIVAGINAVESLLLNSPRKINHMVFQQDSNNPKLHALQKISKDNGLRIHQLPKNKLDYWFKGPHQGVLAFCHSRELEDWAQVKQSLYSPGPYPPHVVVPAAMEDPRNLGACIRSAAGFAVDALVFHNRGGCGLTPSTAKAAAGAAEQLSICQVNDIETELKDLRGQGFRILGLEKKGSVELSKEKFEGPIVFVVGGEDRGIPPHIARCCTGYISIPIAPKVHTYNASVALSLMLYEANRQSGFGRLQR